MTDHASSTTNNAFSVPDTGDGVAGLEVTYKYTLTDPTGTKRTGFIPYDSADSTTYLEKSHLPGDSREVRWRRPKGTAVGEAVLTQPDEAFRNPRNPQERKRRNGIVSRTNNSMANFDIAIATWLHGPAHGPDLEKASTSFINTPGDVTYKMTARWPDASQVSKESDAPICTNHPSSQPTSILPMEDDPYEPPAGDPYEQGGLMDCGLEEWIRYGNH